jgi:hypothetical protein
MFLRRRERYREKNEVRGGGETGSTKWKKALGAANESLAVRSTGASKETAAGKT